jgi:hypothetical protein
MSDRLTALIAFLLATPLSTLADESVARILSPSLGRPAFVEPGGELMVSAIFPAGIALQATLVHPRVTGVAYRLSIPTAPPAEAAVGTPFRITIPADVPPRTYDLEIRAGDSLTRARHCVAVAARREPLRLVHLSDMNIGDLSVPTFELRLVDEINLLAPTAIIATGDLIDATHPQPTQAWPQLVDSLCAFDAPLIVAAGDHDESELFAHYLAPSPIGVVEFGPHRFIVLNDHVLAPLARDAEQIRWAEDALRVATPGLRFVISHASQPVLLNRKQPNAVQRETAFTTWFVGGASGGAVANRDPRVLQTPPASSLLTRDADGAARYRVIDIDSSAAASGKVPTSTVFAVGGLRIAANTAVDGSADRISLTALNQRGAALTRLATVVRLRKTGSQLPWVRGATLDSTADLGVCWECRLAFDLPEKSALRALIGTSAPPPEAAARIGFDLPSQIAVSTERSPQRGLLQPLQKSPLEVTITNVTDAPLDCSPLVRLDGDVVPWRIDGRTRDFVLTAALRIEPRETLRLRLDFSDARVRPGRRSLIVYVNDGQTLTPVTREFDAVPDARQ